jgi:hypothetical protein
MKKVLKIAVVVLVAAFVIGQFIRPDRSAPAVNPEETLEASVQVPENVKAILGRSCSDCHTNTTYFPWYAQITPVNWYLQNHINDGRRELNLNVWNTYSSKKKNKKLEEVCEQVQSGEMPLPSYLWIHRDAALSQEDVKVLCDWAEGLRQTITAQ